MKNRKPNVAVIGAGVSGLNAAHILNQSGFAVTVFEKSRGPGGRISTRREGEWRFDHGAPYFTVRNPIFASQVREWKQEGIVDLWQGKSVEIKSGKIVEAQDPPQRYVGVPAMNALAKHLAQDVTVQYKRRITKLEKSKNFWRLYNESGEHAGDFELLILSIPPAQALDLPPDHLSLISKIKTVKMQPCWSVMVVSESPLPLPFDLAVSEDAVLSRIINNSSKPQRRSGHCWVLQASEQWSQKHIEDRPQAVAEALFGELCKMSGLKNPQTLLLKAHRWRYAVPENPLNEGAIFDSENHLGLCGDWLLQSDLEGAYLSGRLLTDLILQG